jgi:hypothetical protein
MLHGIERAGIDSRESIAIGQHLRDTFRHGELRQLGVTMFLAACAWDVFDRSIPQPGESLAAARHATAASHWEISLE